MSPGIYRDSLLTGFRKVYDVETYDLYRRHCMEHDRPFSRPEFIRLLCGKPLNLAARATSRERA